MVVMFLVSATTASAAAAAIGLAAATLVDKRAWLRRDRLRPRPPRGSALRACGVAVRAACCEPRRRRGEREALLAAGGGA